MLKLVVKEKLSVLESKKVPYRIIKEYGEFGVVLIDVEEDVKGRFLEDARVAVSEIAISESFFREP